jgi:hypothetical protein
MSKIWPISFGAVVLAAGCDIGFDPDNGDEHPDPEKPPITGTISADETWTGMRRLQGRTVIAPGVTVTVAEGAELVFAEAAGVEIKGAMFVYGSAGKKVTMKHADGASYWGPLEVYGSLRVTYGDFTGGAIETNGALANVEVYDTRLYKAAGDYVIMNGGSLTLQYSQLGPNQGETDSTHCNLHVNAATKIDVLRSNISGAPFGIMFYGGVDANFQLNNWFTNGKDVDSKSGVSGNFSGSWFEKGAPSPASGAMFTLDNLASARITQAGPR